MVDPRVAAVTDAERQRLEAMVSRDDQLLARMLSEQSYYCHSSGTLDTKESFLDNIVHGPIVYRSIRRSEEHVRVEGTTALFTGRVAIHVEVGGHPVDLDLRYLAVWIERETGWTFEAWQSTPIGH